MYFREFSQGKHLLSLWPPCADKRLGSAPAPGTHPYSHLHPVLSMYIYLNNIVMLQYLRFLWLKFSFTGVEIQEFDSRVLFPPAFEDNPLIKSDSYDFNSLDLNTQEQLLNIIYQDMFTR